MTGMYNTYYDVSKLTLWADRRGDGKPAPRLTISFRDGNPRFVVYTGEKGVIINFPTDYIIMTTSLNLIENIARGEPGRKVVISSKAPNYVDNKRTNDKRVVSTLYAGKNKDGIVYLLVKETGKPDIVFAFKDNEWHDFEDGDKKQIPISELSKEFALAFTFLTKRALPVFLYEYTKDAFLNGEYKPGVIGKPAVGGQQGGGKTSFASKGAQNAMVGFDDGDIEF